ncbi:MAG: hypothetical protein HPY55_09310 [Firmicutes bacterium]|nr:hypothetical protein [Bacillota bacterium]
MRGERGSVSATLALTFPVLLVAVSLVTDAGVAVWARAVAQASADLAALAAVQEIDLDRLARGERSLVEGAAVARARAVAIDNLNRAVAGLGPIFEVSVDVCVYNPESGGTVVHQRDGRRLRDPTVCVTTGLQATVPSLAAGWRRIAVSAHADASVVEKK